MRSFRTAALAALLTILAVGIADAAPPDDEPTQDGPPDTAVISGTRTSWSIVPATAEGTPARGVSIRLELDPGEIVTEHVLLTNHSEQTVSFDIAGSDGLVSPDGTFDVLPPGAASVDVGAWIDIQPTAEVLAGQSVVVPFTIAVPDRATPGDHPGGIVAGVSSSTPSADGPQVGLTTRVGVRIHLRVAGEIQPAVAISDIRTSYDTSVNPFTPGRLHVTYTVTNTGNVRLSSSQQAEIAGTFGLPTGADTGPGGLVGEQREILPGQRATVDADIDGVWPLGRVSTDIVATQQSSGADPALGTLEQVSATATSWAIPWPQLILVAFVVGVLLAVRMRRRSRRAKFVQALAEAKAEGARQPATAAADSHGDETHRVS